MSGLYRELIRYRGDGCYPMHMPGHKRNTALFSMEDPVSFDITEIEGFDNLQHPEGLLLDLNERLSALYQSRSSFALVNGSTGGILAALGLAVPRGEEVILARNCHKAAYNACLIGGLRPVYVYPEWRPEEGIQGQTAPEEVERQLQQHPRAKAVFLVSPTYEGAVSEIRQIAKAVHRRGIPLIVDEAHGAHLAFHSGFPESALAGGADVVIQSLHKTLPSLTQTAVLHLGQTAEMYGITREKMQSAINLYQTTSPSYVLLASEERCAEILKEQGKMLYEQFMERLRGFYKEAEETLEHCRILPWTDWRDPSKIVVSVRGTDWSGPDLTEFLRTRHRIEMEMESAGYSLGMMTAADTEEGMRRLLQGLQDADRRMMRTDGAGRNFRLPRTEQVLIPSDAMASEGLYRRLEDCAGCIAQEYIYLYPPGIPLVVPGERITEELLRFCREAEEEGFRLRGMQRREELLTVKEK